MKNKSSLPNRSAKSACWAKWHSLLWSRDLWGHLAEPWIYCYKGKKRIIKELKAVIEKEKKRHARVLANEDLKISNRVQFRFPRSGKTKWTSLWPTHWELVVGEKNGHVLLEISLEIPHPPTFHLEIFFYLPFLRGGEFRSNVVHKSGVYSTIRQLRLQE